MTVDIREKFEEEFVEIALRHRAYVLADQGLGLASRNHRKEAVRTFYGTIFSTLGMVQAAQRWYKVDGEEEAAAPLLGREGETYQLQDLLRVVGVRDNVITFRILEEFGKAIERQDLEGRVGFFVHAETVPEVVEYLKCTHVIDYEHLSRKQKNG